jgi:class 3 adenylate cyclase
MSSLTSSGSPPFHPQVQALSLTQRLARRLRGRRRDAMRMPQPVPGDGERVLATVMFTDIVGSTELAGRLGDARWADLLRRHDAALREEVARHRGRVVKSLGDGALVLFDGPSRAVSCAVAVGDRMRGLGLRVRAGLHAGECELLPGDDVGGIAVHITARIADLAEADEVLASGTVRDLSVGSAFALESRGEQHLKGVQDPWRVYAVAGTVEA